ncbi:MAG: ABC transporter ATP-binding protein [Oscillospiraceae bacterium]|nr:ABC transporter ATP-binding protein [Oscillospiraceae bacterium]
MLKLEAVSTFYGNIQALKKISLDVNEGEIVVLIGANGAGKTTTLLSISGLIRHAEGSIKILGQDISKMQPEEIVGLGCVHVPEGRRTFPNLTVEENLKIGASVLIRNGTHMSEIKQDVEKTLERFPNLMARRKKKAWSLSGGEQQMLAIGRGMMARPKLMMLDEPSLGLAPILVQEVFHIINEIRQQGTTVLLVEQNARAALNLADRAYVLETGEIVHAGAAKEILHDKQLIDAYLGG